MRNGSTKKRAMCTVAIMMGLVSVSVYLGCQTLEQMAPPVGSEFQDLAARHSVDLATLELGRQIYLSDCVRCHSVEPIGRYSRGHWRKILPRMAQETKLDKQREAAVEAYVMLARELLEEEAEAAGEIARGRESTSAENVVDTHSTQEGD